MVESHSLVAARSQRHKINGQLAVLQPCSQKNDAAAGRQRVPKARLRQDQSGSGILQQKSQPLRRVSRVQ